MIRSRRGLPAILFILVTAAPAAAQEQTPPPEPPPWGSAPLPEGFDPVSAGLEPAPTVVDSLGLSIHLPAGAAVLTERLGGQVLLSVQDGSPRPMWSMRVEQATPAATLVVSPAAHVAAHVKRLRQGGVDFRIVDNEAVEVRGVRGQRIFIEQTAPDGNSYLAGLLVLPTGAPPIRSFLTFSTLALSENNDLVRPLLEASYATIGIRSIDEVVATQAGRLDAGAAVFQAMTPEALRGLPGQQQWYRIYHPGTDLDGREREIGYTVTEMRIAPKGELNPDRAPETWDDAERVEGLLVSVQGRVILDAAQDAYVDSLGLYWMALDQGSEAWSFLTTRRRGARSSTDAETGIRNSVSAGDPVPKLTVIRSSSMTYEREPFEWVVPGVYMSAALGWALGPLLPRDLDEPLEFSYYAYQDAGDTPAITLRLDRWQRDTGGAAAWRLTSRTGSDRSETHSGYNEAGRLVYRHHPDGARTEPMALEQLRRLWQGKGLRVGAGRRRR